MTPRYLVKLIVSTSVFVGALLFLNTGGILKCFSQLTLFPFLTSLTCAFGSIFVLGVRWYILAMACTPSVPFLRQIHISLWGMFCNSFIPGNLGADGYRFLALKAAAVSKGALAMCLIRERIVGLMGQFGMFLVAFAFWYAPDRKGVEVFASVAWTFGLSNVLLSVLPEFSRWLRRRLAVWPRTPVICDRILEATASGITNLGRGQALWCWSMTGLSQVLWVTGVGIIGRTVSSEVDWCLLGMVIVLTELARFVPLTAQGIGVREAVFSFLFGLAGRSPEEGFAVAAAAYLVLFAAQLLGGACCLLSGRMVPSN